MSKFFTSLQIKLLIVFSIVFAITLVSTGIYLKYSANFTIRNVSNSIELTKAKQVENIISELYLRQDWDELQNTVERLGALTNQQIVVTNSQGKIVADSEDLKLMTVFSRLKARRLSQRGTMARLEGSENRRRANANTTSIEKSIEKKLDGAIKAGKITQEESEAKLKETYGLDKRTTDDELIASLKQKVELGYITQEEANNWLPPRIRRKPITIDLVNNVSEIGHIRILPLENLQLDNGNNLTLANFQPRISNISPLLDKSLIFSGIGAGIIGIIIISLLSRRLFKSVQHLTIAAERISDGDFSQRISETGKDEIGQLSKTFNMMADRLENTNIHRKNLMADIAHEIRTPVSNIQGYIEAVKDNVITPNTKTIDIIHGQVIHLSKLIEDLRLLALTENDSLKLQISHESIQELIEKCISANNLTISDKKLDVHLDINNSLPLVEIDRTRMLQVFDNIIGNAITHTPKKGKINISVKFSKNNTITIFITNSGSSISEKDIPYIFDRFYRVDQSRSRLTGGSGLGLPIAKKLVNAHNGNLKVESKQDDNYPETTFIITLPKKQ